MRRRSMLFKMVSSFVFISTTFHSLTTNFSNFLINTFNKGIWKTTSAWSILNILQVEISIRNSTFFTKIVFIEDCYELMSFNALFSICLSVHIDFLSACLGPDILPVIWNFHEIYEMETFFRLQEYYTQYTRKDGN